MPALPRSLLFCLVVLRAWARCACALILQAVGEGGGVKLYRGGCFLKRSAIAWSLVLIGPVTGWARVHALDIPIEVDGSGSPRCVTLGVPLEAAGAQTTSAGDTPDVLLDVGELGVSGALAAQFRILQRDPLSGAIRWVQVSFLPAPNARRLALVRGHGAFGAADLAREDPEFIHVDTGVARFEVRKQGFDFLHRVVSKGRDLTAVVARPGGVVVLAAGTAYRSALDEQSEVVVEENGPVRAVIRARGVLRDTSGARHLGFTVRLLFERESAAFRAYVTLRNAELAALGPKSFDAAWVELPVALAAEREVEFGNRTGRPCAGFLGAGETAHLFQSDNRWRRDNRTGRILRYLATSRGLEVRIGEKVHNALGDPADVAAGWMRVSDASHAVLAGMRDLAPLFPSGLQVDPDRIAIDLFSRHNPQSLVFSWGAHETRELLFDFSPTTTPEEFLETLEAPPLARCRFEQYRRSGAVFGETRLVSVAQEASFFRELGHSWKLPELGDSDIEVQRQWSFRTTGGWNQFDRDLGYLLDFLRTGQRNFLEQARLGVVWKADQAVFHSDDFDYGERQYRISDVDVEEPDTFHGKGAGSTFDDEHAHWTSMLLYYFLTGDERIREAIEDYGEWRCYRAGNPDYGAIHGGALGHFRLWSRTLRDVALLYDLTGSERYGGALRRMCRALVETRENGTSRGRNLERGYFYFGKENDAKRRVHLFFLTEVHPPAVLAAMRALSKEDPLREELRDYLSGLAWFTLQEAEVGGPARGYPYGYYLTRPNLESGNRGDQTGVLLAHGYEMSGDPRFAQRAGELAWRVLEDQNMLRGSELQTHVRISCWLTRKETGAAFIDPDVHANPDGTWTLEWNAPHGAQAYIIKYGRLPLVENLDFDQVQRSYRVAPDVAMNFWAAHNLPGEPRPGAAGTHERYTTPVLPGGNWQFRIKVLLRVPTQMN